MGLHITVAASKLSALLGSQHAKNRTQSANPNLLDSQLQTKGVVDPVTEELLLQELQTFVDFKSQLRARASDGAGLESIFLQEQRPQELLQQTDSTLLRSLVALIMTGMEAREPNLPVSPGSATMTSGSRLEQLVAHHQNYVAELRRLVLNRKACYAELNELAQLQLNRVVRPSSGKDANQGSNGEAVCWDARKQELQATSLATERLHRNVTSHLKLVEEYADSAMLEVLPPTIG